MDLTLTADTSCKIKEDFHVVVIAVLLDSLHYILHFYLDVETIFFDGLLYEILWPVFLKRGLSMHYRKFVTTLPQEMLLDLQQIYHSLLYCR